MKKQNSSLILILLMTSVLPSAYSSEIDSFHMRNKKIANSNELINKKANDFLAQALIKANKKSHSCEETKLYKKMRKYFRNHLFGQLSPYIINSPEIEKIKVGVEDSIYQDFKWFEAPVPGLIARLFKDPSGKLVRVNEFLIGTDKFEHFMGSGFRYFKTHYLKGKPLEDALNIGLKAETGVYGSVSTGVMSYADMVANFNGMRFWNQVLAKRNDIFGETFGPYVKCEENKWKVTQNRIDLSKYMDYAWSEAHNCSKFRTKKLLNKVLNRIEILEEVTGSEYSCPIDRNKIELAKDKYGDLSETLINSDGHSSMK